MCVDSLPKTGLLLALVLAIQPAYSGAYADTPGNNLDYDQIVAQIPLDQSPIGSVALASLNIALHNARQQAAITLCDGQWAPQGAVVFQQGPIVTQGLAQASGMSSWHYTVLRRPRILACATHSRAAFFLEMSRHLPAWVQVRPARQLTAFQQGETVPPEQETVAVKQAHCGF